MFNMREKILSLLSGEKIDSIPSFSGLIHVTAEGLERETLSLNEVYYDSYKMARAAASTFKLTGMPSATLPLDLCSQAEMLGAKLRYYPDEELRFPQVGKVRFESTKDLAAKITEIYETGKLKLITDAIHVLKQDIGNEVVISGMIPGPFTLLLYVCRPKNVFIEVKKEPNSVRQALLHLSAFLSKIGQAYLNAGTDFITIHEMGGSPGFVGPKPFENLILPAIQELTRELPAPRVLSVCGKADAGLAMLNNSGADVISVDQMTDLKLARSVLKDVMLFGNLDPVGMLLRGDEAHIAASVRRLKETSVDAIWPGCDLVPSTPIQNIRALV